MNLSLYEARPGVLSASVNFRYLFVAFLIRSASLADFQFEIAFAIVLATCAALFVLWTIVAAFPLTALLKELLGALKFIRFLFLRTCQAASAVLCANLGRFALLSVLSPWQLTQVCDLKTGWSVFVKFFIESASETPTAPPS